VILSDLATRRPVFAIVANLLLIIFGVMALQRLPVREYPDIDPPVVSIETRYRGASPEVIETKITQVIEDRVAGLQGIRKLTSTSEEEVSRIVIEFDLERDIDAAANDIRDRVARVMADLPEEADPPEVAKVDQNTEPVLWMNLASDRRSVLDLTDYADRFLVDRLSVIKGVGRVRLSGEWRYAMRVWLDREALAARRLTVADVEAALRVENVEIPAGRLESTAREFSLRTRTGLTTEQDFRELVIGHGRDGAPIRLAEVALVRLGAENERTAARANGNPAISIGIEQQSKANTVELSHAARAELERIQPTLPEDIRLEINYDKADFVDQSMREVIKALAIALGLVLIVIYLFLGNLRSTVIPAVTVPISIMASFTVMAAAGFSVNVLTLLGLVLAIGLVVDDAVVVLENIYRRIEQGQEPLLATVEGAREIGFAVVATTLVLVAVFVPISFLQGNIGRLFGEFGVSLAVAVLFSCFVALTLTPVMCSKMFSQAILRAGFAAGVHSTFHRLRGGYERWLRTLVERPAIVVALALGVLALAAALFQELPAEYAPKEDRGYLFVVMEAPEGASFEYTDAHTREIEAVLLEEVGAGGVLRSLIRIPGKWGGASVNSSRALVLLTPWDERDRSAEELAEALRPRLDRITGVTTQVFTPQGLGVRASSRPIRIVLGGDEYGKVSAWADALMERLEAFPGFINPDKEYDEHKPHMQVSVDRNRAADLGVSLATVGRTLETMLGGRIVTTFLQGGEEYNVVLRGREQQRATPTDLTNIYVRSDRTGELIPLANLVTLEERAQAAELPRFNRLRSVSVSAGLAPGYSLGDAIKQIREIAEEIRPTGGQLEFDGESREFLEAGASLYFTFALALLIVFLVLAAQFESFRLPLTIMMTVPLGVTGALVGLWMRDMSVNVYTQIGVILLIGLAAKNGVLIVEFANQLRDRGEAFTDAIVHAAGIRLRPILMTNLCTTFGAVPLLLAFGAGAESRQAVGVVVVFGVVVATALTLIIVPGFYALLARNTRSPQYLSRMIDRLIERRAEEPATP
jgi:multidrug efflux pump